MNRMILMLALLAVSGGAFAEWFKVGGNENTDSYTDKNSIRKASGKVKMWMLHDFKAPEKDADGQLYLSVKEQKEFDCRQEQRRTLYFSYHSENMGNGNIIYISSEPGKWSPVAPDSLDNNQLKKYCAK